jgi:predicted RND superfamily exporter protein
MMGRLAQACLRRRAFVLAIVSILTVASLAILPRANLAADIISLFMDDAGPAQRYRRLKQEFGDTEPFLLAWSDEAPLSQESLERGRRVAEKLQSWPEVDAAISLASAPRVVADVAGLKVETWGNALEGADDEAREALLEELAATPELSALVAEKRNATVVVAFLEDFQKIGIPRQLTFEEDLLRVARDAGVADDVVVHAVGFPVITSVILDAAIFNLTTLIPLAVLVLVIVVLLLFRRLWPVVFTGVIGGLSMLWASAAAIAIEPDVTLLHTMSPILILVIALADAIFVLHAYVRRLHAGDEKEAAIVAAIAEVGPACVLTSISTFVSFASLLLIPAPAMQALGFISGVGVASALLLVVTLGPILLALLPTPPAAQSTSRVRRAIDSVVDGTRRIATGRPRLVVGVALLLIVASIAGLPTLEIETDFARRFPDSHRLVQAETFISEHFGGHGVVELVVRTKEGGALEPELLDAIRRVEAQALTHEDVLSALSAADVVARAHAAFVPEQAASSPIPKSPELVTQLLFLLESGGDDPLRGMVTDDRAAQRITLRVRPTGVREIGALGDLFAEQARAELPAGVTVEPTGLSVMFGGWLDSLYAAQLEGLGLVALFTILILTLGLRSIRVGLLSLIPNGLPALLFIGSLALPGQHLDSDYLIVAIVGLGIAVDDTIHFLARYRAAWFELGDTKLALEETYRSVGPAMVQTTIILVVGVSPILLSEYTGSRMFSTQLSRVLIGALFADLFLLPALIQLGWLRFGPAPSGGAAEAASSE